MMYVRMYMYVSVTIRNVINYMHGLAVLEGDIRIPCIGT